MDNTKRAQAAWAVLLALLGLLAFGSGLLPSSPASPSPSPSGPGTGSGTGRGSGSGSGAGSGSSSGSGSGSGSGSETGSESGSGSGSSSGSGDGWTLPDDNDEVDPGTDSPTDPTPEDRPDEETGPGLVEDEQDRFPSDDEENAEHNEEFFEGTEDFEDATTYGDSDEPVPEFDSIEDVQEYAARSSAPQSGAVDAGAANQPIHDSGTGLFEYARENPTNAAVIVGGGAALAASGTGLVLSAAGYTTAVSTAQAASLAAVGVPASTYENANEDLRELVDGEEDNSGSSSDEDEGSDDGPSSDPWEDSGGEQAPEQDDDWQPEDGGHSPGPSIDPGGGSDNDGDSGSSSDPWDDSGGEQAPEQGDDWQPEDGGHSPGPGIDPDDGSSDDGGSRNDDSGDDAEESDLPLTPEPDPSDGWMPGSGGHTTGVM